MQTKVAFDISNAEQVQTNISEFNPATDNLISPGIQVTIEYYVENGVNIATKLTSDGDEKEPYSPVAIGKVNAVSDTELSISVTEGDNIGETITFNLSVCDPISDPISVDSQVAIAYYTKPCLKFITASLLFRKSSEFLRQIFLVPSGIKCYNEETKFYTGK